MRLTRAVLALLFAVTLTALASCSVPTPSEPAAGADRSRTRVVATDQGTVEIPAAPQRIVVLNSSLTGYLYAMGEHVHGSIPLNTDARGWPPEWESEAVAQGTKRIPWSNDGFDLEALLKEQPDLIIAGGQGFPAMQAIKAYAQLSEIAPTVVVSQKLAGWQDQLTFIAGDVLGKPEVGQRLIGDYRAKVAKVKDAIKLPPTPVSYLLIMPDQRAYSIPESAALPQTLAAVGFTPYPVLAQNPGIKLFGSGDSFETSSEEIGRLIAGDSLFVLGFQSDVTSVAKLAADPRYAGLPAIKGQHAYDLPYWAFRADYQGTMQLLDRIEKDFAR